MITLDGWLLPNARFALLWAAGARPHHASVGVVHRRSQCSRTSPDHSVKRALQQGGWYRKPGV